MKLLMKQFNLKSVVLVGCLAAMMSFTAYSQAAPALPTLQDFTKDASSNSFTTRSRVSLKQATGIARKHTGGRVLSAHTKQRGAAVEYRVRMLVNGERVVTVTVDQSGHVRDRR